MIFDYQLMFIDDECCQVENNVTTGVLGDAIDLSGSGQGKGFEGLIAIAFTQDTTATADPEITFSLETSADANFLESKDIPLMIPAMKKADLEAGTVLSSPLPKIGLERYVRLRIATDSAINCIGIKAGFVLDAPQV